MSLRLTRYRTSTMSRNRGSRLMRAYGQSRMRQFLWTSWGTPIFSASSWK